MGHIESWRNSKTLICQSEYDGLEEHQKEGKYSSEKIESYFTLFELLLAPKSNPLLAVEELHFTKQGSMTSGEFHSHIVKIAKRCQFPNPEAEERAIRDTIFLGMNSQVVRVDTGADVNCMNEKTFHELFPEVELSVCPHKIQNFGNSVADISILGQFCTYFQFRGEKYLNTFIVTNTNNCPNLLSYGATFRMGVLLPNYPEENVLRGENVPNFKVNTSEGTSASNVFQILKSLQLKQYQDRCHSNTMHSNSKMFHTKQYRIQHNWLLLSGPPHPPQLWLGQ